jgi:benzodiazapine receptor
VDDDLERVGVDARTDGGAELGHKPAPFMTLPVTIAATLTILLLAVGGLTTKVGQWYRELRKPSWNPPSWVFAPAWTIILGLAAWAGVLAWTHTAEVSVHIRIAALFAANVILHALWSPLFFNLQRPDWALLEVPFLWLSVLALIIGLAPLTPLAVFLLAPYLLWVSFAAVLNLTIVRLNRPFGAQPG